MVLPDGTSPARQAGSARTASEALEKGEDALQLMGCAGLLTVMCAHFCRRSNATAFCALYWNALSRKPSTRTSRECIARVWRRRAVRTGAAGGRRSPQVTLPFGLLVATRQNQQQGGLPCSCGAAIRVSSSLLPATCCRQLGRCRASGNRQNCACECGSRGSGCCRCRRAPGRRWCSGTCRRRRSLQAAGGCAAKEGTADGQHQPA